MREWGHCSGPGRLEEFWEGMETGTVRSKPLRMNGQGGRKEGVLAAETMGG